MLTSEQEQAITRFRRAHGRYWKAALRLRWENGNYRNNPDSGLLQQVRNELGPRWLLNYNPNKEM